MLRRHSDTSEQAPACPTHRRAARMPVLFVLGLFTCVVAVLSGSLLVRAQGPGAASQPHGTAARAMPVSAAAGPVQAPTALQIQINQALGNQAGRYVAGKPTAIRVLVPAPVTPVVGQDRVVVKRAGVTVATLAPVNRQATRIVDFECTSFAACGNWRAGSYTFEATVGGATATATANFVDRRAVKVLAIGITANYGGDVREPTGTWKKLGEYMKQVYPIGLAGFSWKMEPDVDASAAKYDLLTEDGMYQLWDDLRGWQPKECLANPNLPGCYNVIVGFVRDNQGPDEDTQGYTYAGAPVTIVTETDPDAGATVAHEIAHTYGVGDEYPGGVLKCDSNPPPSTFVGEDWFNRKNKQFRCTASTAVAYPKPSSTLIAASTDFPYEVGGRRGLPDMASFMGSGGSITQSEFWISPALWSWLFDRLAPLPAVRAHAAAAIRYVAAFGRIDQQDAVLLEPWYSFTDSTVVEDPGGEYAIQAVDALSNTLASISFDLQFYANTNPPRELAAAPFALAAPFPAQTAAFRIVKGLTVLEVIPVQPHAPQAEILAPTADEVVDGEYTIVWEGSHADGAPLFYSVEYSDNGEDWAVLATEITTTIWTEDFSLAPGSDETVGRIRVTATDGVNAVDAESEFFNVPPKAPEVYIEEPLDGGHFGVVERIGFYGLGYDLQDEWLYEDSELAWESDVQGSLGGGAELNLDTLEPGQHVITLYAMNSYDLVSSASVTITVGDFKAYLPMTTK